jgi:MbtH protein
MSSGTSTDENEALLKVVVNDDGQYSIWPTDREVPAGWSEAGKVGSRPECLAYIEEVWTDMRPLGLRRAMDEPR